MPLLFALGQHAALHAVQSRLKATESLFAFLDDVYVATTPDRVGEVYTALATKLYPHSRIRINGGKTQVWNAACLRPPLAIIWKGSLKQKTQMPGCGEDQTSHPENKVSAFLAHLWVMRTS